MSRSSDQLGHIHRNWFARPADNLAVALLGQVLVRRLPGGVRLAGRIIETEAYLGTDDQASHARNAHRSPRNEAMYAQPGTAYVYFTYGMHHCFNIACADLHVPHAVLIRALQPLEGVTAMRYNRSRPGKPSPHDRDLCSGPARLCQAMRIDRALNTHDLTSRRRLWLEHAATSLLPGERIENTPRIGLGTSSGEWFHAPLRWAIVFHGTDPHRLYTPRQP